MYVEYRYDNKVFKRILALIYHGRRLHNYVKHLLMKRKSRAYTNGERITKKNITLYVVKLKPYIMWKIKRKLANAKKSGMREKKPKD